MSRQATAARSGDLARRITHRREELGLTREEVAQRARMDVGYLDYLEHNPAASLGSGTWLRLARVLETTPASLAGGDVGRPPGPGRAGPHPVLESLTREQCEDHLVAGGVGRVVFSADRGPVALPVNFRLVDGRVVFRTQPTASPAITAGATVGFEVDRIDEAMSEGWSVLVSGRAQRVEDRTELDELALIGLESWAGGTRETVIRIEIDEVSGRAIRQQRRRTPPRVLHRQSDLLGCRGGGGGEASAASTDDLARLITRLRGVIGALSGYLPDPSDGAAWVHFETALSDLHGALIALEGVHGGSPASAPTHPSHAPLRSDDPPTSPATH